MHVRFLPVEKRTPDLYPYLPFGYPDVVLQDGTKSTGPDLPPCEAEHLMDDCLVDALRHAL